MIPNTKRIQMVKLVNTRLPRHIVKWLDLLVEKDVYKSRSEAVRDFLREFVLASGKRGSK